MPKPTKTKALRPPGQKRSPRATVKTIHHVPGAKAIMGSDERLLMLRDRAYRLKTYGNSLTQIAEILYREFELETKPPKATVYDWIEAVSAQGRKALEKVAENFIRDIYDRGEEMVRSLMPAAIDNFVVQRYQIIGGIRMAVIDENELKDRISACAEVRKQHETVMKALGVTRPQEEGGAAMTPEATRLFVINSVTNFLVKPGEKVPEEKRAKVLELIAGDPLIDEM